MSGLQEDGSGVDSQLVRERKNGTVSGTGLDRRKRGLRCKLTQA